MKKLCIKQNKKPLNLTKEQLKKISFNALNNPETKKYIADEIKYLANK